MNALRNALTASYGKFGPGDPTMLVVYKQDGTGEALRYSHLVRISFSGDSLLSLIMTDCIVTLEGTGLDQLGERLQRRTVRYILEQGEIVGDTHIERMSITYAKS